MKHLFLLLLSGLLAATPAAAQDWPRARPVHIVVGFAPGSTTDLVARLVAPKLSEAIGQSVIVENKPGAGGNVATQQVKRVAPDGYVLLMTSVAYAVNPTLYPNAGYDPFTDFAPVILGPSTPNIITVNPAVPAKNLQELVALARKDRLSYASSGIGTTTHLSMERIKMAAKVDITHVPYQPAQNGLTSQRNSPAEFAAFVRAEIPKWAKAVKASGAKLHWITVGARTLRFRAAAFRPRPRSESAPSAVRTQAARARRRAC